jgi:hypothetical protein
MTKQVVSSARDMRAALDSLRTFCTGRRDHADSHRPFHNPLATGKRAGLMEAYNAILHELDQYEVSEQRRHDAFERLLDMQEAARNRDSEQRTRAIDRANTALRMYALLTGEDEEAVYEELTNALIERHEQQS